MQPHLNEASIAFIEDNEDHIFMAKRQFDEERFANVVTYYRNSQDFTKDLEYGKIKPDLVFIDRALKNSDLNGDQIAMYMRSRKEFSDIEICMMSVADISREQANDYDRQRIRFFMQKPILNENLDKVIKSSIKLWNLVVVKDDAEKKAA